MIHIFPHNAAKDVIIRQLVKVDVIEKPHDNTAYHASSEIKFHHVLCFEYWCQEFGLICNETKIQNLTI